MSLIRVGAKENVLAVVKRSNGKIDFYKGHNIVTNAGDEHYARKIIGEASNIGGSLYLRLGTDTTTPTKTDTDVTTPISGSGKIVDAGFPQRDYVDNGNTNGGTNVVTYSFTYDVGEVVATGISEGAIVDDPDSPTVALNHFLFDSSFDVANNDQLIVYVNHAFIGV